MSTIEIEIDTTLGTAYIRLSDTKVTRTVEHTPVINIDLDEFGVAVGIELLSSGVELPFADLLSQFHVHSDVVELLRLIRPGTDSYAALTSGSEGRTVGGRAPLPA